MKAQIIFKSGATVEVDIDEITTGRTPITNKLTSLNWKTPADWTAKLHTVDLSEIAAIVIRDEPNGPTAQ